MKTGLAAGVFCLAIGGVAFAGSIMDTAKETFQPIPYQAPEIKGNPASPEKIQLGKMLYFEPRLSKSALVSCNFCHNVGMGGDDYQETATGHGWQRGPRNSPTVLNAVFNVAQFWDGRAKDLKEQAKGPVQASVEMSNTPEGAVKTLNSMPEYRELFKKAFPGEKDPVTFDNMAAAIEVFEATLITPDSRFDNFLRGDAKALNEEELKGLALFMDKGCSDCHGGLNMGGEDYFAFGVEERPSVEIIAGDKGRFKVTKSVEDEYVFKAPSLRNIELTPPYFHSGKVWSLKDAIKIMGTAQLGSELNGQEVDAIYAFLKTSTGVQPKVEYPILPPSTDTTPHPVLD
ncbi:MAG TPA: cytochrome-c peroxidase [Desulfobulbus sp.]|nr:cytochrome-c peroxidase [Desulfobulbus sp.]